MCVKACVHVPKILHLILAKRLRNDSLKYYHDCQSWYFFLSLFPLQYFLHCSILGLKKLGKVPTTHTSGPSVDIGKTLLERNATRIETMIQWLKQTKKTCIEIFPLNRYCLRSKIYSTGKSLERPQPVTPTPHSYSRWAGAHLGWGG